VAEREGTLQLGALVWFYREVNPRGAGERSPILLLHGLPAQSLIWGDLLPRLAERGFRAIAPDWIGFGFSSKPDRRSFAYTPDAYVEALEGFRDALGLERFSLVVQGFLGSVGVQYAFRHPERIERLVVLNAPLAAGSKLPWKMRRWGWPLVGDMLTQDPLLVDRTLEGGSGYRIAEANLAAYRQPFLQSSDAGRALGAAIKNLNLGQAMAELEAGWPNWKKQTLLVWGSADPWLSPQRAQQLAAAPNIELVELERAQHYPQEHWSPEIDPHLGTFLRRKSL